MSMQPFTIDELQEFLNTHDAGVLLSGGHSPYLGKYCALEAVGQLRGIPWTDNPLDVGIPDMRCINDACWSSDAARTVAMLPMLAAVSRWATWTPEQKQQWVSCVVIQTVRQILSQTPSLPKSVCTQCQQVATLEDAKVAVDAARALGVWAAIAAAAAVRAAAEMGAAAETAATAAATAWAARAAAWAAEAAEAAMPNADTILTLACVIWQEEADKITWQAPAAFTLS